MTLVSPQKLPIPSRYPKKEWEFYKGMIVPHNTMRDEQGNPIFGKVDSDFVEKAWKERICQFCGRKIAKTDWACFPGAFGMEIFQEAPLHTECAAYSIQVCPHISAAAKEGRIGLAVCKTYAVRLFGPPDWSDVVGCIPFWEVKKQKDILYLSMAHDLAYREGGEAYCKNHPEHDSIGHMTSDEFLVWTGNRRL